MSSTNSHEKQTRHLQRQSTRNSSRNYYYGKPKHQSNSRQRAPSVDSLTSSSSSSISETLKDKQRKKGIKSRDSGFRSPNQQQQQQYRTESPQQIYAVSNKHASKKHADRPISPTGSVGQRSVKTTTTTMSAGLEDRPRSRQQREVKSASTQAKSSEKVSKPPSPFQKLAKFFGPSPGQQQTKRKQQAAAAH